MFGNTTKTDGMIDKEGNNKLNGNFGIFSQCFGATFLSCKNVI